MFDSLKDRLQSVFSGLGKRGALSEGDVDAALREVRLALLEADVALPVVRQFMERIREKAVGAAVLKAVRPDQQVIKLVHDGLVDVLGGDAAPLRIDVTPPAVILMAGLQGSGKTTFSAKLANYLKSKHGRTPLMVAGDVYRPAAIDQIKVLGEQIGVEVYSEVENKNPVQIAQNAVAYAKSKGLNTVIVDTAGRLAVDEQMMNEIAEVHKAIQPEEGG